MPPVDDFMPTCLAHVDKLLATIDRSYTDVQIKPVLEQVCWHEHYFPSVTEDGFSDKEACHEFAEMLTQARDVELENGSKDLYTTFCEKYYVHKGGILHMLTPHAPEPEAPPPPVKEGLSYFWQIFLISVGAVAIIVVGFVSAK